MDIIYLGDIHGNFDFINWFVKAHKITNTAIIQVGDFGIGFNSKEYEKRQLKKLNQTLKKFDVDLYAIRGNHDNPAYFDGKFNDHDRVFLMPDYSTKVIGGKNHLFVGGAISVDRKLRTPGIDYWEDEIFLLKENEIKKQKGIDTLVTHNSMSFLPPYTINSEVIYFCNNDFGLMDDILEERLLMSKMWDMLAEENKNKIELHVYGHFHFDQTTYVGGTKHVMLGIEKTLYVKNQTN